MVSVSLVLRYYLDFFLVYNTITVAIYTVDLPRYILALWNIGVVKLLQLIITIEAGDVEQTKVLLTYIAMMTYFLIGFYSFSSGQISSLHLFLTLQQAGVFLFASYYLERLTCNCTAQQQRAFLKQTVMWCDCSICLERKLQDTIILPCQHTFHTKCVEPWFARQLTCPLCRQSVNPFNT